jgi:N-acetylglucosamine kinase-like BadF-type ATPase
VPIYLGLDCGGSTCRALALDDSGEPVFLAQGGSANLASTPEATLERSLRRALEGLPPVDFVCGCFAGLISESRREQAERLLRRFIPEPTPLRLEPDFAAALRACPTGTDVCVIAGTGSVVCSQHQGGEWVRSGGGGYLLGDEGSGFRYGRAGIRQFVRDPHQGSEHLQETIAKLFRTEDPNEVVAAVYTGTSPAALVAGVATAVFHDAERKLPYALAIVDQETSDLAEIVIAHCRRFLPGHDAPQIGLAGGTWKKRVVRDAFTEKFAKFLPSARVVRSEMPPAHGAALLAMELAAAR